MTSLASLPPELFVCILDYIPSINLQQTTISLLRIFSYGRIPNWRRYLFYHIHLKSANNVRMLSVRMLSKHLQRSSGDAEFIKKFSFATWTSWTADAKTAIDVVLMIPESMHRHGFCTRSLEAPLSQAHAELVLPFSPISTLVSFTTPHCAVPVLTRCL